MLNKTKADISNPILGHITFVAVAAPTLLLSGGCGESGVGPAVFDTAVMSSSLTTSPPLDANEAATAWRWVGVKADRDARCPIPNGGNWKTAHLFGGDRDDVQAIPRGLQSYCLYTGPTLELGVNDTPSELAALLRGGELVALHVDRAVLALSATPADLFEQELGPVFAKWSLHHAGKIKEMPAHDNEWAPTRVALLDTSPTRSPDQVPGPTEVQGNSTHGYSLANLARELVCDREGRCVADISTRLALPLRYNRKGELIVDEVDGGHFGTLSWLAQAIRSEVEAWGGGQGNSLVLNLSLGWLPTYGGDDSRAEEWPVDVAAVHSAIADARCRGALILAAAGNTSGGPSDNVGPLLPAAWEMISAPDHKGCRRLTGQRAPFSKSKFRPLVYAVGGVDGQGEDLAIARPRGRPRVVAHGDHVTTRSANGTFPTQTGTSVSTVVASAAAAVAWSYRPDADADRIMGALYKGGDPIGVQADFCLAGAPCPKKSRRARVCTALLAACKFGGGACPAGPLPRCRRWKKHSPRVPPAIFEVLTSAATGVDGGVYVHPAQSDPACGARSLYNDVPAMAADPCPSEQYYGAVAQPWTHSQPGHDPCPNCVVMMSNGAVLLSNPTGFGSYSSTALTVWRSGGVQTYNLSLPNVTQLVMKFPPSAFTGTTSVVLSASQGGQSSSSSLWLAF